jgi:hypothetical protein
VNIFLFTLLFSSLIFQKLVNNSMQKNLYLFGSLLTLCGTPLFFCNVFLHKHPDSSSSGRRMPTGSERNAVRWMNKMHPAHDPGTSKEEEIPTSAFRIRTD